MIVRSVPAILIGWLLLALAASAEAKLPKHQIYSLFNQANEAFRQANSTIDDSEQAKKLYEKAILSYEKLISEGQIENAKLHYNLANAYFLKEDVGRAILNYRRAEKLDKADSNIAKNLAFARSRRIDKVEVKAEKRVLQTLFFWHYDFSMKSKTILVCLCFAIVCVCLTITVWLGRNAPSTVTAVIFGILLGCFSVSAGVEAATEGRRVCGVITSAEVVAYQGDGQNYPPSFKKPLHTGTEFDLLEQRPGWLHIKLSDDSDGWISQTSAELI